MPAIVPATTTVCAVEIATLSAALRIGLGVAETALLFACFHLGYLFADPLRRFAMREGLAPWWRRSA